MADPNVVPLRAASQDKRPGTGKGKAKTAGDGAGKTARPRPSGVDALAAGAARASGERAKRRSTPLLPDSGDAAEAQAQASTPAGTHRPKPVAKPRPVRAATPARTETRRKPAPRRPKVVAAVEAPAPEETEAAAAPVQAAPDRVHVSGIEELVAAAVGLLRTAAEAAGLSGEEVEHRVAGTLAFLRRRLTGDYTVDDFGFDADFTEHVYLPLLRPLYRSWFRVEVRGIENIPSEGGALVVANHSGTIALDSLMTQVAVHDEHPARRHLRMLGADLVFQTPVVGDVARKSGSTLAANADAERLLSSGELAGVWPEGFKGIGKPFSERYKLQRFGRGGFVSAALRTGVPIIPCSIVGAEEIYPIIGNMKTVARLLGSPYAPVTPTWPLLGPLGLVPLPSKWIIEFGTPVETASLGPQAADDPMLVFDLTDQVRETIQQTLYSLLMRRRSVFF